MEVKSVRPFESKKIKKNTVTISLGEVSQMTLKVHWIIQSKLNEGHPERKERLYIQSGHLFRCSRLLVSGIQCDVENCLMQLHVGPYHVVSAEIGVAIAMPIENHADCEVRGVILFSWLLRS